MNGRWTRMTVGVVAVMMLALPAIALGSKTFFTASDGKASIFMGLKDSGGKQKIVDFSWDGLKCGSDRFTGGLDDAIKVKNDGSFESEQPVSGTSEGVEIDAKLKGQVNQNVAKIAGKLKFTGDCEGKADFKATESAG
jgi:hypothetical protein